MTGDHFPDVLIEVRSPGEFSDVIKQILALVKDGRLRLATEPGPALYEVTLDQLTPNGPWPDFLDMKFSGAGGRTYRLVIETYHGAGGVWRPE